MADPQIKSDEAPELDALHAAQKARRGCWRNCCLFIVLLILAVGGTGLWSIARSGLLTVPVLTKLAHRESPAPSRLVVTTQADADSLGQVLTEATAAMDRTTGVMEVRLTEAQLNAVLRSDKNPNLNIAFMGDTAEWFNPLELEKVTLYVTARVRPGAEDGHLRLNLVGLQIGHLTIPTGFLNWAGRMLQARLIDTNQLVKQIEFHELRIDGDTFVIRGKLPPDFGQGL